MNRRELNTLYNQYRNFTSPLFMQTDTRKIYQEVKRQALLDRVSNKQIQRFKDSVEGISRSYARRILRDRPRYLQFRQWKSFAPLNILLGKTDDSPFRPRLRRPISLRGPYLYLIFFFFFCFQAICALSPKSMAVQEGRRLYWSSRIVFPV